MEILEVREIKSFTQNQAVLCDTARMQTYVFQCLLHLSEHARALYSDKFQFVFQDFPNVL